MTIRLCAALGLVLLLVPTLFAQDLGPHFTRIKDGIYVQTARPTPPATSNVGIIATSEGVILVDSGQTPIDTREVAEAVKKLSSQPVRFIINTETHPDHASGHWVFSPPAVVINHEGAGAEMQQTYDPKRVSELEARSTEMRAAVQGFRLVPPHIEYSGDKMTMRLGERTLVLLNLGTTHSLANTAVWLPNERVLFAASVAVEGQFNAIRPHTNIPDMLAVMRTMKALNAEVVVPGHGVPTTDRLFDDYSRYLETLLQRVGALVAKGRTLDQIKQEVRLPEYENLPLAKERMPNNIEAAYRAIQGGYKP